MKILFQGDSITDAGRSTEMGSMTSIGQGYAMLISGALGLRDPGRHELINRAVSGNRIVDIYARIKADGWNLSPDVLSLLVGINDVWHEVDFQNGVDAKRFEHIYRTLTEETLERLPGIRLMLLEPFVLRGAVTEAKWGIFSTETASRAAVTKRVAEAYGQTFVPLQTVFDEACKLCPADYWLADGVHPTPAGHQLIAREWIRAFDALA